MLSLFNTLGRTKQVFVPIYPGKVSFYTCGPTVYNYAHIGNFRAYLAADTLRRWLENGHNLSVQWVLNITDVDDKTIRDSKVRYPDLSPKEALKKFTRHYEDIFFQDLEKLGIPHSAFYANPRATDYIEQMQNLVRQISKKGFAKEVGGSVFFDVKKWSEANTYGKLLALDLSSLKTGTRSLADEIEKDDLSDFVLWKAEKEGEPAWDFDYFGKNLSGRPGWHLECSAMEEDIFGLPFDIHSGGVDLVFPHHEDEIAQSCCGYTKEPTNYWIHNEHLLVEGKKMSKSLGNFFTLHDLLEKGFSSEAIRFFLVTNHYRAKLNLTEEGLHGAQNVLDKIENFLRRVTTGDSGETCLRDEIKTFIHTAEEGFLLAMNDDLNTPVAIASVHALITQLSPLAPFSLPEEEKIFSFFSFVETVLGVPLIPQQQDIPEEILALAELREKARVEKDWAESDRLRDLLLEKGFIIQDFAMGFELLPKK